MDANYFCTPCPMHEYNPEPECAWCHGYLNFYTPIPAMITRDPALLHAFDSPLMSAAGPASMEVFPPPEPATYQGLQGVDPNDNSGFDAFFKYGEYAADHHGPVLEGMDMTPAALPSANPPSFQMRKQEEVPAGAFKHAGGIFAVEGYWGINPPNLPPLNFEEQNRQHEQEMDVQEHQKRNEYFAELTEGEFSLGNAPEVEAAQISSGIHASPPDVPSPVLNKEGPGSPISESSPVADEDQQMVDADYEAIEGIIASDSDLDISGHEDDIEMDDEAEQADPSSDEPEIDENDDEDDIQMNDEAEQADSPSSSSSSDDGSEEQVVDNNNITLLPPSKLRLPFTHTSPKPHSTPCPLCCTHNRPAFKALRPQLKNKPLQTFIGRYWRERLTLEQREVWEGIVKEDMSIWNAAQQ